MGKIFGTDGARGIVNDDLTCNLALKIGASVARVLKETDDKSKLNFLIGSDTRISKDMLTHAVATGVMSEGCSIINVGVLPTPAISYLTMKYNMDGAFVISASHNPSQYNGIKVLDKNGVKLSEELEDECENIILNDFMLNKNVNECGSFENKENATEDYVNYLAGTINNDISGIKILIDTANGAASITAPLVFEKLSANFDVINNEPDGLNINENAGSTHIEGLRKKVVDGGYDIGIAYDGDADRTILIDEKGNEIDGDKLLAIISRSLRKKGKLNKDTIVATVMSNLGLNKYARDNGLELLQTNVGDRYVLEEMLKNGFNLGGEQSGHVILLDYNPTGDRNTNIFNVNTSNIRRRQKSIRIRRNG